MDGQYDVILLSLPSKNMDYPSLGLPTLAVALKARGFRVFIIDVNIELKDLLLTPAGMQELREEILPFLLYTNFNNPAIRERLAKLLTIIETLQREYGVSLVSDIKTALQERRYSDVFGDRGNYHLVRDFFKFISRLHLLFPILHGNPLTERYLAHTTPFSYYSRLAERIIKAAPLLIGFSLMEIQRPSTLWFARKLKTELSYKGAVVFGGPDISYHRETYLQLFNFLDYAIYNEGEDAIVALCSILKTGSQNLQEVPNLIYREVEEVKTTPLEKLERFPALLPDFSDLPLNKYLTPVFPIQASRGCSWGRCSFCRHFGTYCRQYYQRPAAETVDQIENLMQKHRSRLFHFADDEMPSRLKTLIADEILRRQMKVEILAYSRFESRITKDILRKWFDAGFVVIEWGMESASQKVLDNMVKGTSVEKAQRTLVEAAEVGILNKLFMFHDYPTETYEDLQISLDFLERNIRMGFARPFLEIRTRLELLKGTRLYDEALSSQWKTDQCRPFRKVRFPRGLLTAQAGYETHANYLVKAAQCKQSLNRVAELMDSKNVLPVNDDTVAIDLILEDLRLKGIPLSVHSRLQYA